MEVEFKPYPLFQVGDLVTLKVLPDSLFTIIYIGNFIHITNEEQADIYPYKKLVTSFELDLHPLQIRDEKLKKILDEKR